MKTTVFDTKTVVFLTFTHHFPGLFFSLTPTFDTNRVLTPFEPRNTAWDDIIQLFLTPILIGVIFLLQAFSVGVKLPQTLPNPYFPCPRWCQRIRKNHAFSPC